MEDKEVLGVFLLLVFVNIFTMLGMYMIYTLLGMWLFILCVLICVAGAVIIVGGIYQWRYGQYWTI